MVVFRSVANFQNRHIRRGGKYRIVGLWSLIPAVVTSLVAAAWKPTWSWWAYYLTYLPASLGYSIFLCCQLGEPPHSLSDLKTDVRIIVALISAVDSRSMVRDIAITVEDAKTRLHSLKPLRCYTPFERLEGHWAWLLAVRSRSGR